MDKLIAFITSLPKVENANYIDVPRELLESLNIITEHNYLHVYARATEKYIYVGKVYCLQIRGISCLDTKIPVIFWEDYD